MQTRTFPFSRPRALLMAGAALLTGVPVGARAFEYQTGDWQFSLDTTLSSSVEIRTSDVDHSFVGIANGGTFGVANADNGDLNYRPGGPVGAPQRITTELQGKNGDLGFFVRATGFYDPIIDSGVDNARFPLDRAAVRDIGADLRLLDAYAFARPEIFGHPIDIRVGNQALNWGESTFIQFGINSITPLDTTALHTPGSELRTAFLPIPVVDLKTEIIPDLTIEGFWQPYWTRYKLDPVGSFFNTSDGLLDGGRYSNLFSFFPDAYSTVYAANLALGDAFGGAIPRGVDRHPTGLDEFGFALRKNVPELNDAEFGLYFENYHSRIPFASFHTGSSNINSAFAGSPLSVFPDPPGPFLAGTQTYFDKTYLSTSRFYADYPKDIRLLGLSWNFSAPDGWAIQGEISHRFDQPIQLATADMALAINAPAVCYAQSVSPVLASACDAAKADPVIQATGGVAHFDQNIQGWKRFGVTQIQSTATKLFSAIPQFDINSIAVVDEIGLDYVHDFPRERGLLFAPYSTDTNSAFTEAATVDLAPVPGTNHTVGYLSTKGFATQFSAGDTLAVIIDMPNVLPYGIGMKPTVSLQYDFWGTSPLGVNNFQANTAAASTGVTFTYLQAWSLGVQYTNHFPVFAGGKFYGLIDRDFVSASLSYEF